MKEGKASSGKAKMHSVKVSSVIIETGQLIIRLKYFFSCIITETAIPSCRRTILC